jgi:hypothetical protein
MKNRSSFIHLFIAVCSAGVAGYAAEVDMPGRFTIEQDLFLAHFDSKTDVDDIHSVAGVATMLADHRFAEVSCHAVAGAYGIQEGLYVPANDLFELAFGPHWSDAHADRAKALEEVSQRALGVLNANGRIWIAEAGQSDFSAALIRNLQDQAPEIDLKDRIHIVQHADWNEEVTTPEDLAFVKSAVSYHRIPDGNTDGNGTPDFRKDEVIDWRKYVTDPRLIAIWEKAIAIANTYNGADGRYLNESIKKGGLDFSDVAETAWIFGFEDLADANDFFQEFSTDRPKAAK